MNPSRHRLVILLLGCFGLLLLSGCTMNFITDINADGSGVFSVEYGFTEEELTTLGMTLDENLCTSMMEGSEPVPNATSRQETRGTETWCIYEAPFANLDELSIIYAGMETTVNTLKIEEDVLVYDVTANMGEDSEMVMGALSASWIVTMPGTVNDHNATVSDGSTLTWDLAQGGLINIRATSKVGGLSATVWWGVGLGVACLCLLMLVGVVVLVILLVRRNKKKAAPPVAN